MGRRYLSRQEWKRYLRIVAKELQGQKVTRVEIKVQEKGDAEVKKTYRPTFV